MVGFAFGTSFLTCVSSGLCGDCFVCTGALTALLSDSFDPLFTGVFFSSTLFCACAGACVCGHRATMTNVIVHKLHSTESLLH